MQVKSLGVLCALLLLGSVAAAQQVRFDNTVMMTTSSGLGYANPGVLFRPGFELENQWSLLRASGGIGSSRKRETGDGWVRRFRVDAHFKFRKLLVGGGVSGAHLTTSRWSKGSIHPMIGGGFQYQQARALVSYVLPGTDDQNGVQGVDVQVRLQLSKHVAFNPEITMIRYYSTGRPDLPRKFGLAAALGFTFSLGKTGFEVPQ